MKEIGFLIIGILFLAGGAFSIWLGISKKKKCTEVIDAEITGTKRHRGTGKNRTTDYSPIVKYVVDGNEYSGEANISSIMPSKFKAGEMLTIQYDPENPQTFVVKGKLGNLIWSIFAFLLGAAFVVVYFMK